MTLASWIIVGLIAGWIAQKILGKGKGGLVPKLLTGVIGAVIGGYVFEYFGKSGVTGINFYSIVVATVGAMILLLIAKMIND